MDGSTEQQSVSSDRSLTHSVNLRQSNVLQVLGEDLFAPFRAKHVPGTVLWCNFELARELGFDVPKSNQLDQRLHEQLIRAFSVRALKAMEEAHGLETITLYADKYGGDGVAPCRGSGRAAFAPYCNAFIKGLGHTPLYRHDDPDDFEHSHGGLNLDQALAEAVFGEVNANLFEKKAARVLTIIDQGDCITYPKGASPGGGKTFPQAIIVRVGSHLRPAHILAQKCWDHRSRFDLFVAMTRDSGQLVMQPENGSGPRVPDLRATMLRVLDDHTRIAALQVRWRISHLKLSASNMRMDGGMLDVTTERFHPRAAPIHPDHSLVDSERTPYPDYADRAQRLSVLWRALRGSIPRNRQKTFNAVSLNVKKEMDRFYARHLQQQLLCATGLKAAVAERIAAEQPMVVRRLVDVLTRMTRITNPARISENRQQISDVAALDVFNLLRTYPQHYFGNAKSEDMEIACRELNPIYKGNLFHVRHKRAAVMQLVAEFTETYRELMESCMALAAEYYGSTESMQISIKSRAAFENRPASMLFRPAYSELFERVMDIYRHSRNREVVREAIDGTISHSLRNVDGLLKPGRSRRLADGGVELQIRMHEGVRYAVRAWDDQAETRLLHISIPVPRRTQHPVHSLNAVSHAGLGGTGLRYRFTINGWVTSQDIPANVESHNPKQLHVACGILERPGSCGTLEGYFYDIDSMRDHRRSRGRVKESYCFAIPDRIELAELFTNSSCYTTANKLPGVI